MDTELSVNCNNYSISVTIHFFFAATNLRAVKKKLNYEHLLLLQRPKTNYPFFPQNKATTGLRMMNWLVACGDAIGFLCQSGWSSSTVLKRFAFSAASWPKLPASSSQSQLQSTSLWSGWSQTLEKKQRKEGHTPVIQRPKYLEGKQASQLIFNLTVPCYVILFSCNNLQCKVGLTCKVKGK